MLLGETADGHSLTAVMQCFLVTAVNKAVLLLCIVNSELALPATVFSLFVRIQRLWPLLKAIYTL